MIFTVIKTSALDRFLTQSIILLTVPATRGNPAERSASRCWRRKPYGRP